MIPTSRLAYLNKIQDGLVFFEGFENDNFINAEGWDTNQGTPVNSSDQYLPQSNGIKSFKCNGTGSTLCNIIYPVTNQTPGMLFQAWIYDDGTTIGEGPYIKFKTNAGNFVQFGIRNNVSTTDYCFNASGVFTEDNFSSNGGVSPRSVGWHNISVSMEIDAFSPSNREVNVFLDGSMLDTIGLLPKAEFITNVYVCSGTLSDTGSAFGYFDNINLFLNSSILFIGQSNILDNQNFYYTAPGTDVFGGAQINLPYTLLNFHIYDETLGVFPIKNAVITVAPVGDILPIIESAFIRDINPGDIFSYNVIDFGQKTMPFNPAEVTLINQNQSTSGIMETLFNAYKDTYMIGFRTLSGLDLKKQLNNFYRYCSQGPQFSFLMSTAFNAFGIIESAVVGSQVITMNNFSGVWPASQFVAGRKYRAFNIENTLKQTVTVTAVADPNLSTLEFIEYPFQPGDMVVEDTFYPFLELGSNADGFQMTDERYIRFNWNQGCQDYNGV